MEGRMKKLVVVSILALVGAVPLCADDDLAASVAADYEASLADLFVWFHQNAELSFREFETAKRLAEELRAAGVEVTEGVGGTGVVGMLRNGDGPLVMVRADMDGLPILEDSGLSYASIATQEDIDGEMKPVMHACGHDVHVTSMVGTARQLARMRDRWSGTVMFVGQPAEERVGGAKAMLEDGLYERFGVPEAALAFHVSAGSPAGKVQIEGGPIASSSDSVDLTVYGIGAHGASPHLGRDPIYISAQIILALQSLVSREIPPLESGVVTVGSIHGGSKHNIIPREVKLQLTVRAENQQTRQRLLAGIQRIAANTARAAGMPESRLPRFEIIEGTPPTVNDFELVERLEAAFVRDLGPDALFEEEREGMGAEDFAYFVMTDDQVPGAYFVVGGTAQADLDAQEAGGPPVPSHHSPFFKIEPEESITMGTRAMTFAVLELLGNE
jgi:hippurate hydrolase